MVRLAFVVLSSSTTSARPFVNRTALVTFTASAVMSSQ